MSVSWPVKVYDDDRYEYVLVDQVDLRSWAECEETALEEFTGGVDSEGRPLRLVFTDGEPELVIDVS